MAIEDTVGGHHGKGIGGALVKGAVITAAVGILGSAALLAYANVSNTSVPELWQNITSRHQEEYVPPKPTQQPSQLTTYQKQALEQIALIRQKEPGLADVLAAQAWAKDDSLIQAYGLEQLKKFSSIVSEGSYTLDSLVSGTSTTTMLALSKDEFRRTTGLQIIKTSIPLIAQFLGVNYQRQLLVINMDAADSSNSPGGINISTGEWSVRTFTHEGGHEVYNHGVDTFAPSWFEENAAEAAGQYAIFEFQKNKPEWWNLTTNFPKWGNLDHTVPDPDTLIYRNAIRYYQQHPEEVRPLASITFKDFEKDLVDSFRLGSIVFFKYRELVGDAAFKEALNDVRTIKVLRSATVNKVISNQDLEAILRQHVPPDRLPAFEQLYQQRVYGVLETKP